MYFSTVHDKILSLIDQSSHDKELFKDISNVFYDLDLAAQNCSIYLQKIGRKKKEIEKDKQTDNFIALSKNSISLLQACKKRALVAYRAGLSCEDQRKREFLNFQKFDEFRLINHLNLAISTLSLCCSLYKDTEKDENILKSFIFDLLSYYMHKAMDCHYLNKLQEDAEKSPRTCTSQSVDKVLSEVYLDSQRINNVRQFEIEEEDLYCIRYKPKEPEKKDKNKGMQDMLINRVKDGFWWFFDNPHRRIYDFVMTKAEFDAQNEKIKRERRDALKYINQKEDSFTGNEDLEGAHPLPETIQKRWYYTKYFNDSMKSTQLDKPGNFKVYLEDYVDDNPLKVMKMCGEILKELKLQDKTNDLNKVFSDLRYDKLKDNKEIIKKLLSKKNLKTAFRPIRMFLFYKSVSDQVSDKEEIKIDDDFLKRTNEKHLKELEHQKLLQILKFTTTVSLVVVIVLGYKLCQRMAKIRPSIKSK